MPLLMCPNCQAGMQEISRNGVMIDVCTQCRGVWLDRGEMEKLLGTVRQVEQEWYRETEDLYKHSGKPYPKKKKHSKLLDIFEIFD